MIQVGQKLPTVTLTHMNAEGPAAATTDELFGGKKVVLFAVPGAFTPTCSAQHLPGFVGSAGAIKAKGVDLIACVSVNDVFVMAGWAKDQNTGDDVMMLADAAGDLASALGLEFDLSARGLGVRSQRYAMVIDNGVVTTLNVDDSGALETSTAEAILAAL